MVSCKSVVLGVIMLGSLFSLTSTKNDPLPYGEKPHDYDTNELSKQKYINDTIKFDGQITALRNFWKNPNYDCFPEITDTTKKVVQVNWWNYEEMIVDPSSGEFVSNTPWFLIFVHGNSWESNINIESMQHLAAHFDGRVQFGFVSVPMEEELSYAYEVWSWPRSYYLDEMGLAHGFPYGLVSFEKTKDWIETRDFKKSPSIFKAPIRATTYKLWWAYAKKEVRTYYVANWQPIIELYLRKTPFTYVYDADPTDFENVKLNQKTNRQIIFIFAGFAWIVEVIWDAIVAATCPPKKEKPKSIMNRKAAKEKKEKEDAKTEKTEANSEDTKKDK